jgi:hypothetical protein
MSSQTNINIHGFMCLVENETKSTDCMAGRLIGATQREILVAGGVVDLSRHLFAPKQTPPHQ